MYKLSIITMSALVLLLGTVPSRAEIYSGSLQYTPPWPADSGDGLWVSPSNLQWQADHVTVAWTVTNEDNSQPGFPWKYSYHFFLTGSPQANFSHMIIETSSTMTSADVAGLTGATIYSIGIQNPSDPSENGVGANPGMPGSIYGIKFDPLVVDGTTDWTTTFFADRAPVWGDFYGRCGGHQGGINYAYNYNNTDGVEKGFLSPDPADPTDPPSNGSVDFHILRPDTVVAPEPSTLILLAIGTLCLPAFSFRRRKR